MNPLYINKVMNGRDRTELLAKGTSITLDRVNWPEYPYKPHVTIHLGWEKTSLHLLFQVKEKSFQARVTHTNGMVCNDSCVEFFFQGADSNIYYNLELNGIGTIHLKKGSGRENRQILSEEIIRGISIKSSLENRVYPLGADEKEWELMVTLPLEPLELTGSTRGEDLADLVLKGNFYKCGDELIPPHYLSWAPIKTVKPDFHSPSYFRDIHFRR